MATGGIARRKAQVKTEARTPTEARARILAAALRLFSTVGFDASGTKRLAEEAGVPLGLVFYYFKTKEALLEAILSTQSLKGAVVSALQSCSLNGPRTAEETCEALAAASLQLMEWLTENHEWAMLFFRELTLDRASAKVLRTERAEALALLGQWLGKWSAGGRHSAADVESAAQMLASSLLIGALVDRPRDLKAFARRVSSIVLHGLSH